MRLVEGPLRRVVPEGLPPLLTGPDVAARDRTFAALLGMGKLDLAELRKASEDA